jgi:YgiT-type zinc finger domain-containing protein
MPKETNTKPSSSVKAGALMCPVCCVEYVEVEVDFEYDGTILKNVKMLRCPSCEEELFSPEQQEAITAQITRAANSSKSNP